MASTTLTGRSRGPVLFTVGLSHRTAPVELRESVDFSKGGTTEALAALATRGVAREMVVLSTCNRAEIYAVAGPEAPDAVGRFFAEYHQLPLARLSDHLYVRRGADAARHLFRVSAGLDSLVVGEPQILGQVKAAYATASDHGYTAAVINRLFHSAFGVGKRVRSETGLAEGAVSVSYAAISLARKIFGDLTGLNVVILGAGGMAKLTGLHLKAQDVRQITITSRTLTTAQVLARQLEARAVPWPDMTAALGAADIVVSATGAVDPVLTRSNVQEVMRHRRQRPLFIIDIAVPRDVEASVGDLDQVFLYNIDDLQGIVKENLVRRSTELERAEAIVDEEVARFTSWLQSRDIIPTVIALRQRFEAIRQAELARLEPKLAALEPEARERLDEITHLIIEKLLLTPTEQLKSVRDDGMAAAYSDALNRLFRLAADEENEESRTPARVTPLRRD
jgi:glutamyl-tRNA reductase